MDLGKRIQFLRIKYDMTQKELGDKIGVSVVSISGWENGSRKPSAEAIIALSETFNISTDYLLGVSNIREQDAILLNRSEKTLLSNYRALDKCGRNIVDTLCRLEKTRVETDMLTPSANSNILPLKQSSTRYIPKYMTPSAAGLSAPLDGYDFEMILVDETVPEDADFAVRIQGDSMNPYIYDGDTVYVKKDMELSIGDVGIFCINGVMYCKQYYLDSGQNLILLSSNPYLKHTNVFVATDSGIDVKCYGKVLLDFCIDLPNYIYEK